MKLSKILSIIILTAFTFNQNYIYVMAQGIPTPPSAPSAPSVPSAPSQPPAPPSSPSNPNNNPSPTATPTSVSQNPSTITPTISPTATPTQPSSSNNTPTTQPQVSPTPSIVSNQSNETEAVQEQNSGNNNTGSDSNNSAGNSSSNESSIETNNDAEINNAIVLVGETGWNDSNRNTGDAEILTGNSNVVGTLENLANQTLSSVTNCQSNCGSSTNSINSSNSNTGSSSENLAINNQDSSIIVTNNNYAILDSDIIAVTDSGHNSANKNTGNAYIETGDANVGLTVVNVANTNISGITTSEFDVFDDHRGDIVIDVATLGSGVTDNASNLNTGSNSNNIANNNSNTSLTFINTNDATVANDLAIDAVTGRNEADKNTGDSSIVTGDANVMANVVNLVNAGITSGTEVLIATVNVFGDWIGDLVFTDSTTNCNSNCENSGYAQNSKTGYGTNNVASSESNISTNKITENNALINNGIIVDANTGMNEVDDNTGGANTETGSINVSASETTVANANVEDGTWWLVIVNDAGRWIGEIMGADGQSTGQSVDLGSSNDSTGANSNNLSDSTTNYQENIQTTNNAEINNQIIVNADTGNNSSEKNTGSGSVKTGDVNVAANIVNFVNTNFKGSRVVVAFVNVFGSWMGNVVTPGIENKENNENVGGPSEEVILVDESYSQSNTSVLNDSNNNDNEEIQNEEFSLQNSNSESETDEQSEKVNVSKLNKSKKVLGTSYVIDSETAKRVANGTWIVEVDPTITVTPAPVMSGFNENSTDAWWWTLGVWALVSAGIGALNFVRQGMWSLINR